MKLFLRNKTFLMIIIYNDHIKRNQVFTITAMKAAVVPTTKLSLDDYPRVTYVFKTKVSQKYPDNISSISITVYISI